MDWVGLVGFDGIRGYCEIVKDTDVERSGSPCFWVRSRVVGATRPKWYLHGPTGLMPD